MKSKYLPLLVVFAIVAVAMFYAHDASAQCAMCSLTAENSTKGDNSQGKGLNDGIIFLLAIPYLIAIGMGILWYKKYKKNNVPAVSPFDK